MSVQEIGPGTNLKTADIYSWKGQVSSLSVQSALNVHNYMVATSVADNASAAFNPYVFFSTVAATVSTPITLGPA